MVGAASDEEAESSVVVSVTGSEIGSRLTGSVAEGELDDELEFVTLTVVAFVEFRPPPTNFEAPLAFLWLLPCL